MLLVLNQAWPHEPVAVAFGLVAGGLAVLWVIGALWVGEWWVARCRPRLDLAAAKGGFAREPVLGVASLASWRLLQPWVHHGSRGGSPGHALRILAWGIALRAPLLLLLAVASLRRPVAALVMLILVLAWGRLVPRCLGAGAISPGAVFLARRCAPSESSQLLAAWRFAWRRARRRWPWLLLPSVVAGLLLSGSLGSPRVPLELAPLELLGWTALGMGLVAALPLALLELLPLLLVLAWLGLPPTSLVASGLTAALSERRALAVAAVLLRPPAARRFRWCALGLALLSPVVALLPPVWP